MIANKNALFDSLINSLLEEKETRIVYEYNRQPKTSLPPILSTPHALMDPTSLFKSI